MNQDLAYYFQSIFNAVSILVIYHSPPNDFLADNYGAWTMLVLFPLVIGLFNWRSAGVAINCTVGSSSFTFSPLLHHIFPASLSKSIILTSSRPPPPILGSRSQISDLLQNFGLTTTRQPCHSPHAFLRHHGCFGAQCWCGNCK